MPIFMKYDGIDGDIHGITDGTSNTLMVAEKHYGLTQPDGGYVITSVEHAASGSTRDAGIAWVSGLGGTRGMDADADWLMS